MISASNAASNQTNSGASLELIAEDIRTQLRTTSHAVFAVGALLLTAKEIVKHGEFSVWAQAQCGLSVRSTQRYMRAARRLEGKYDITSFLQPSTLFALTAKGVDDTVLNAILDQGRDRPLQDEQVRSLLANAQTPDESGPLSSPTATAGLDDAWEAFFDKWKSAETADIHEFCRLRSAEISEWLTRAAAMASDGPSRQSDVDPVLALLSSRPEREAGSSVEDTASYTHDIPSPSQATADEDDPLDIPTYLRRTA